MKFTQLKESLKMDFFARSSKAIPMWVNSHAFLTVTSTFHDVINPQTGEQIHRCRYGAEEAAEAVVFRSCCPITVGGYGNAARRVFWVAWLMRWKTMPGILPNC